MLFKEVIGQEIIKQRLINSVQNNRISHTQLFYGHEGSGNLALALAYIQYLNCTGKTNDDSCGKCSSCVKQSRLIHPDLHFSYPIIAKTDKTKATDYISEWRKALLSNPYINYRQWMDRLEAENKQGNISVVECQDILKRLSLKAFESSYKAMIIWMPEYLRETGNILLKILEEPPPKTVFILVAENIDMLLLTILSRTQLIKINKIADTDLKKVLIDKYCLPEDKANEIVFLSNGNYNKALELLTENENDNFEFFTKWMRLCYGNNGLPLVQLTDEAASLGREKQKILLQYAINIFREVILYGMSLHSLIKIQGKELDFIKKFSSVVNASNNHPIIEELNKAYFHIERNVNSKIVFLNLSIKIGSMLSAKNSMLINS